MSDCVENFLFHFRILSRTETWNQPNNPDDMFTRLWMSPLMIHTRADTLIHTHRFTFTWRVNYHSCDEELAVLHQPHGNGSRDVKMKWKSGGCVDTKTRRAEEETFLSQLRDKLVGMQRKKHLWLKNTGVAAKNAADGRQWGGAGMGDGLRGWFARTEPQLLIQPSYDTPIYQPRDETQTSWLIYRNNSSDLI